MTPRLTVLAAVEPAPDQGSPGLLGFVFTFLLALVLVLLAFSLSRHLRKLDRTPAPDAAPPGATSSSATSEEVGALPPTSSDATGGAAGGSEAAEGHGDTTQEGPPA